MNTKNSKKIVPATVFAAIIVLLAFSVMSTTASADVSKELDPVEGDLGEEVTVTIDVTVTAEDGAVTVIDTLPSELTYIGNFKVNTVADDPTVEKQEISYAIEDPGDYTIEFDVKVTEASWEDLDVDNEVVVTNESGEIGRDTAEFTILPFEELHKNVGIPMADVVFSFDLTGSMWDEIDEATSQATAIIDNVQTVVADAAFGVVTHVDYPQTYTDYCSYTATYGSLASGDYAYKTDLAITTSAASAISTISGLGTYDGGDGPQDYSRVLDETRSLSWRAGTKKIVVLFGDNLPHDCDFWSYSTGGDPGLDEIANTDDDLDFETVVASLASEGITVLAVDCSGGSYAGFYQYLADETGGEYFELENAEDISEAIKELLKAEALTIEEKTETQWLLVIDIVNTFSYTMVDTVITDRFGAEIEIDDELAESTHGTASWDFGPGKGKPNKSKKVFLTWDIGDLPEGETARLILLVSTDLNPAGKQEYTTDGVYELNSGATLKFKDPDQNMMQLSAVTDSIYVTVLEVPEVDD